MERDIDQSQEDPLQHLQLGNNMKHLRFQLNMFIQQNYSKVKTFGYKFLLKHKLTLTKYMKEVVYHNRDIDELLLCLIAKTYRLKIGVALSEGGFWCLQNGLTSKHCDLIYLCTSKKESLHKPYFIGTTKLGVEFDGNPSTNEQVMISEHSKQSSSNTENTATENCGRMEMSEVPAKTSYGHTEKFTTVPSTNISGHTDYSRTITSTNISECTTIPDDGPSKKQSRQK